MAGSGKKSKIKNKAEPGVIQWPQSRARGRKATLRKIRGIAQALDSGVPLIAVDPALGREDSRAAVVVFHRGEVVAQWALGARGAVTTEAALAGLLTQIQAVAQGVAEIYPGGILLAIEELRGGVVNPHLHWAAGTLIAGIASTIRVLRMIELPICYWKAHAAQDPSYTAKTDIADATQIGRTVYALCRHLQGVDLQRRTKRARTPGKHKRRRNR